MKRTDLALAGVLMLLAAAPAFAAPPEPSAKPGVCRPLPRDKRIVKLELKPDSALLDVITMYSTLTCKKMHVMGDVSAHKSTIKTIDLLTVDELSTLVRDAASKAGVAYAETATALHVGTAR